MARLTMRRGPVPGKVFDLMADVITIGRGTKNDIVIDNVDVSRDHCRLVRVATDYELHDLNSANGTFVNGQRVNGNRILPPSSLIELGDSITLEYERSPITQPLPKDSVGGPVRSTEPLETFFLVLKMGREPERVYTLQTDIVRLGRDLSNDIVVQDPEVSRWHVQLHREEGGYSVKDLGSTNGTSVNGVRLAGPRQLSLNDQIELGSSTRLYYVRTLSDVPATASLEDSPLTLDQGATQIETREASRTPEMLDLSRKRATSRLGSGLELGALENHVFISYAREDWEQIVAPLTLVLQDAGVNVWVDQYLVQGGNDWMSAIEQALRECWLLIVILSPEAIESRYTRLEYRYFINREKPVIPFVFKPIEKMPPELSGLEAIRYDKENSKRSFQRLILEILHKRT